MSQSLPQNLFTPLQLAVAPGATVYTSPANTYTILAGASAANTTATPRYLNIYLVTSGGSKGVTNAVVYQLVVPANKSVGITAGLAGQMLNPGDFISAEAEAATAITLRISGLQVQV